MHERYRFQTILLSALVISLLGAISIYAGNQWSYEHQKQQVENERTSHIQATATYQAETGVGLNVPDNFDKSLLGRIARIWPMVIDSDELYPSSCTGLITDTNLIMNSPNYNSDIVETKLLTTDHCLDNEDMLDIVLLDGSHYGASILNTEKLNTNEEINQDAPILIYAYSNSSVWSTAQKFDESVAVASANSLNVGDQVVTCGFPAAIQAEDSVSSTSLFCTTSTISGSREGFTETYPAEFGSGFSGAPVFNYQSEAIGVVRGSEALSASQYGYFSPIK